MNCILCDFVNDSVLIVDSAGPVIGKGVLKGLGLARALKRGAHDLFDQVVDSLEDFLVRALPVEIIIPGVIRENDLHSIRPLSVTLASWSWAIDSIRRLVFLGDRSRYAVSSRAS